MYKETLFLSLCKRNMYLHINMYVYTDTLHLDIYLPHIQEKTLQDRHADMY